MEFASKEHKKVYQRIKKMVENLFGETGAIPHEDSPGWLIPAGSAMVHLTVASWRDDIHLLQFVAYLTSGTELSPQCLRYLLDENHTNVFGGFGIDKDTDISFCHSAIADTCSKKELRIIVMAMNSMADDVDDFIVERWGGKRAYD